MADRKAIEALLSGESGHILAALESIATDVPIYHIEDGTGLYFASDGRQVSRSAIGSNPGISAGSGTYVNAVIIRYAPGTDIQSILKRQK